ncbi:MAG: hypothetical protein OEY14_11000, partial [Myxococcales bacterium]|nr:hypothetical protein [Myxococcales bacterium]
AWTLAGCPSEPLEDEAEGIEEAADPRSSAAPSAPARPPPAASTSSPAGQGPFAPESLVLVSREHADRVDLVRWETLETLVSIPTGPCPHVIAVDPAAGRAYVGAYEASESGGVDAITIVDLRQGRRVGAFALSSCAKPHGLALDDAQRLWVTCEQEGTLKVLSARDGRELASLPSGAERTHLLFAFEGGASIMASHLDQAFLSVYEGPSEAPSRTIPLPVRGAEEVDLADDGTLWITHPALGKVSALAAPDRSSTITLEVGDTPIHLLAGADSILVTVAAEGEIATIDPERITLGARFALDAMGGDIAWPREDRLIVSDALGGRLLLLELPSGAILRERALEGGPNHLALGTGGRRAPASRASARRR